MTMIIACILSVVLILWLVTGILRTPFHKVTFSAGASLFFLFSFEVLILETNLYFGISVAMLWAAFMWFLVEPELVRDAEEWYQSGDLSYDSYVDLFIGPEDETRWMICVVLFWLVVLSAGTWYSLKFTEDMYLVASKYFVLPIVAFIFLFKFRCLIAHLCYWRFENKVEQQHMRAMEKMSVEENETAYD